MAYTKFLVVLVVSALAFVAMAADKPAEEQDDLKAEGSFLHGAYAPAYGYPGFYGGYGPYGYGYGLYGHGLGFGYGLYRR